MSRLIAELRLAVRRLLGEPGFLFAALFTIALGVGAVAAIYSVVDGVLLRPLPYPQSERIIRIHRIQPPFSGPVSRQLLADWRDASRTQFDAFGAWVGAVATLSGDGEAERLSGYQVTPGFWDVMALPAQLGRYFGEDEENRSEAVVVLSDALWQRRFGGAPDIIGRDIRLNGQPHRVIGVAPAAFRYPSSADIFLPTHLPASTSSRGNSSLHVVARLAPASTLEQARTVLDETSRALAEQYPDNHADLSTRLTPLPELLNSAVREPLLVLLAASALVLLIACANLANLLLARGSRRQRELSVRIALGAGRGGLVRIVLIEAALIALGGGLLGVALAAIGVPLLLRGAPELLPSHGVVEIDLQVVLVCLAVALATVLLCALWPALRAASASPAVALKQDGRGGSGGPERSRMRSVLVVAEVALSLTLLAGAGLLIESLRRLGDVDIGIESDGRLTASVVLSRPPLTGATDWRDDYWHRVRHNGAQLTPMLERLQAIPGVERVALADALPLATTNNSSSSITLPGTELPTEGPDMPWAQWRFVNADYFDALGIALRRGRALTDFEAPVGEWPTSIVVNETFVRRYLGDRDPIGQVVGNLLGGEVTIVGVVADSRLFGREAEPPPEAYMPLLSAPVDQFHLALAVRGEPLDHAEPLRRTLQMFDPNIPLLQIRPMAELLAGGDELRRFNTQLMLVFSTVAVLLAALGLYAVMAYSVAQRRHELGIRMSLGADARRVLADVLGGGMRLVVLGSLIGVAGALLLGRAIASQLYGVGAADPPVLAAVVVLLLVVGLLACLVPAHRATRIAPMAALREE